VELRGEQALELSAALRAAAALALAALALAAAGPAAAQTTGQPTFPVYDSKGNVIGTPFVPPPAKPILTEKQAIALALAKPKVADWVARYEGEKLTKDATFDGDSRTWKVKVWAPEPAGQIVEAKVDDSTTAVTEAWTGPQVAWKMARGYKGAFGREINNPLVWIGFCVLFLLGLADWRRVLSVRNLDLLVLLSFSISLRFFNEGEVFTAMMLVYPPFAYLLARLVWIGVRGRGSPSSRPVWPVWLLLAATVFVAGFRVGLNLEGSNTIDVGYASVIGAQRIAGQGEMPYGHMPTDDGEECGPPDSEGYVRERIQTNGRCESANERGDTYGPVTYLAYVPGWALFGWTGHWDSLPAAHFTSILFDLLAIVGLALVGRRFGGNRLAATLAFAWAAYPFTQYASNSNTNDAIMPALLLLGFWLVASAPARGAAVALAGWTKFAALVLAPLWLTYPGRGRPRGSALRFAAGFALASAAVFSVLLLEPSLVEAARTFWERSVGWQVGRESPFSIWGWGQYEAAGIPDLKWVQRGLQAALVVAALALAFVPRTKSPLQLAALSGALLVGFELVLTHWSYLYLPWFFPFAAFALLAAAPRSRPEPPAEEEPRDSERRALVPAG
jgi:hypothetical protein